MSEDEKPEFQQFDLSPDVECPKPTLNDLTRTGAEIAMSLTSKYPPAACLATLKIAVKAMCTLIELSVGDHADEVKRDADVLADVVTITKQEILGDG